MRPLWSEQKTTARLRASSSGSALLEQHGSSYFFEGATNMSWNVRCVLWASTHVHDVAFRPGVLTRPTIHTIYLFTYKHLLWCNTNYTDADNYFASVHYDCDDNCMQLIELMGSFCWSSWLWKFSFVMNPCIHALRIILKGELLFVLYTVCSDPLDHVYCDCLSKFKQREKRDNNKLIGNYLMSRHICRSNCSVLQPVH